MKLSELVKVAGVIIKREIHIRKGKADDGFAIIGINSKLSNPSQLFERGTS